MKKSLLMIALVCFAILSVISASAQEDPAGDDPIVEFAQPGPYGVGVRQMVFIDAARDDRELFTLIWYPIAPDEASYTDPIMDAAPAMTDAPYPVIFYSHGQFDDAFGALPFVAHLASYGYVTVSISHMDRLPSGLELVDRPLDVLVVLNELAALTDDALVNVLDTDNVGVTGYSGGGDTALLLAGARVNPPVYLEWCAHADNSTTCWFSKIWDFVETYQAQFYADAGDGLWQPVVDSRIRASAPMAFCEGLVFGEEGLRDITMPILLVGNVNDEYCPYERDAVYVYEHLRSSEHDLLSIKTGHLSLNDDKQIQSIHNHFLTAFFGFHLQGREEYAAYLSEDYVNQFELLTWGVFILDEIVVVDDLDYPPGLLFTTPNKGMPLKDEPTLDATAVGNCRNTEATVLRVTEIGDGERWVELDCGRFTGWIQKSKLDN